MKVLVIGTGCREHALVKVLQEDSKVTQVYILPEKPSLQNVISLPSSLLNDSNLLANHLIKEDIRLVVIGPEKPLVESLADFLRQRGINVFGPAGAAAQLEGSKIFAKQFMKKYKIPTASYQVVSSVSDVLRESENFFPPYVLKADGLAGGKGVFLCSTVSELEVTAQNLFEHKVLGSAGKQAVLEDFQSGEELSVFVITNGQSYQMLPIARDYKRLYDNQQGPNTGGMGAVAPITITDDLKQKIANAIIKPTLSGLQSNGAAYNGVLYIGLMIHKGIPKVLEYNVRFGDPEAQVLLPLLDGSWFEVFYKTAIGESIKLKWKNQHTVCLVLASEGYPNHPVKDALIEGDIHDRSPSSYILHGAIQKRHNQWVVNGGRVLNVISVGSSRAACIKEVYKNVKKLSWQGMQYRTDIGN